MLERTPFLFLPKSEIKMDYQALRQKLAPVLKAIAIRLSGQSAFIDQDDLYQEMSIYLWEKYGSGVPAGINDSYIVNGCKYHILNYLRKNRDNVHLLRLDQAGNEEQLNLADILPQPGESMHRQLDKRLTFEEIRNNGFSQREKQILVYLAQGLTVREVGRKLGISHVMVVKHKKSLIDKWQAKHQVTKR
ncbi:helix-turn-helix transcriptional regulator [Candidatus Omnitrophota bacterium]